LFHLFADAVRATIFGAIHERGKRPVSYSEVVGGFREGTAVRRAEGLPFVTATARAGERERLKALRTANAPLNVS